MCAAGGFKLTKFVSNDREVIASIPKEERAHGIKNIDLDQSRLPIERALGISIERSTTDEAWHSCDNKFNL